jgi:hypothetical protein
LASSTTQQKRLVLTDPRRALRQSQEDCLPTWDPRLSAAGNRAARQLAGLLDRLAKMLSWMRYRGRADLMACDREVLWEGFGRLVVETRAVAEAGEDFLTELKQV